MTICFVFKGGYTLQTKCKEFSVSRNVLGSITGYECNGITENKPIELNFAVPYSKDALYGEKYVARNTETISSKCTTW